jgi:hypothetical protein
MKFVMNNSDSRVIRACMEKRYSHNAMQRRTSLGLYTSAQFGVLMGELISVSSIKSNHGVCTHWSGALSCRQGRTLRVSDIISTSL